MSNKIFISGNIGKGAVRVTPNGKTVCGFSVADQVGYGDNAKTQWFECSLWGEKAENPKLTDLLVKGTKVSIMGELELEPAGDYPARMKVFVLDIMDINTKGGQKPAKDTRPGMDKQAPNFDDFDDFDDDIPF
jgi:single-strand DNA-binding protein